MIDLEKNKHIISYYKNNGKKSGILVAVLVPGKNSVHFGWSKVGMDKDGNHKDQFDSERAKQIAMFRLGSAVSENRSGLKNLPHEMVDFTKAFIERCKKYFQPPTFQDEITVNKGIVHLKKNKNNSTEDVNEPVKAEMASHIK